MATTRINLVFAAVIATILGVASAPAAERTGIVLLHDKAGTPADMAELGRSLAAAGFAVDAPEMCWSHDRMYDTGLTECLGAVAASIARLTSEGSARVVVAGAGIGGRAALAFALSRTDLAGIVVLGPVEDLSIAARSQDVSWRIAAARSAIAYGQGGNRARYADVAEGQLVAVNASSKAYLDFVDPAGPLALGAKLRKLATPILWVAAPKEYVTAARFTKLFARNPANSYDAADPAVAPRAPLPDLIAGWIAGLPSE